MPPRSRREARLLLGAGAILTVSAAAEMLPVSDREARLFLSGRGLISELNGRKCVVWQAVINQLWPDADKDGTCGAPAVVALPRIALDPL